MDTTAKGRAENGAQEARSASDGRAQLLVPGSK